ncbi:InlB B-repeat-containing protein [Collinsella sp. LCP19S3_H3]|uniref:InlB B-repeat-containing protein n=1 Tax=Collinsella sp. LCP19S3_H3 TaxID=3438768 RepID=UPI003F8F4B95
MKSFLKTASRAVAALFAVALVTMGVASPAFADDVTSTITNARTGKTYDKLADATADAQTGDTIKLGKGNYTLYGVSSTDHTKGKDLTFEGLGTDKTAWNIGALVPDPANYGTEYNGDYSFDGAGTVTFKNMTLRSGSADYLGFIRADKTVVDSCIVNGKTFYWGYSSAEFRNTTFNAPGGDYSIWTYSSPTMTFDGCTFNCAGKAINVFTDYGAGKNDITVNVNNCTFKSTSPNKTALKINDSNMVDKENKIDYKYKINITGNTTVTGLKTDPVTCSKVFGFGGELYGENSQNSGRTDVTIDGKLVWSGGKMLTHDYTDGEHDNAYDVTYTEWTSDNTGTWTRTGTPKCEFCGFVKPDFVEKAYDLSYDLNGSEDKQAVDFATVEHVTEAEVTAEQPVRKGYSFVGWNTAKDGSGTSYAAGDKVELSAPVTLYAQWKKDEPAPKPSDNKPAGKPAKKTKANKQALPSTGDASANIVAAMGIMAIACFVASAVVSKVRK